jgi:hypothetical protein
MTRGTVRRTWALVVAGGLVALTAACGGSSGSSDSSDSGAAADAGSGGGDPTTKVTVDVTGEVTLKGTLSALPATYSGVDYKSCADYGKGETDDGNPYFVLPRDLKGDVDGKQILVGAEIKDYKGPAAYPAEQLTDQGTPAGVSFSGKLYFIGSGATSTATIDANGGGKWEFTNLSVQNANNTQSSGKLSGSVTWTCNNG